MSIDFKAIFDHVRANRIWVLIILLALLCFSMLDIAIEKFLAKREIVKDEAILQSVTGNIVSIEKQMEKFLANGAAIIESEYLKNPNPTIDQVKDFLNKANIDSLFIYNSAGRPEFSSTGSLQNPKFKDYYARFNSLFKRDDYYRDVMAKTREIISLPIIIPVEGWNYPFKLSILWNKKLNKFFEVKIRNVGIKEILLDDINIHQEILSLKIITPSGYVLAEVNHNDKLDDATVKTPKITPINRYIDSIKIDELKNAILLKSSFGDNKINKNAASRGLTNDDKYYFYTAIIEFSRSDLNKQILLVRIAFIIITILLFGIIYFIRNNFHQKHLHKLSLLNQAHQIHHDVASPLMALDWGLNAMIRNKDITENEKTTQLKQSIEAVKDIINDLHYLHDDSIQTNLKLSTELIYPIIYSAFSSSRLLLSNDKKINHLTFKATKDWNLLVNINLAALRRVLINLIKNAIESEGKITISLKRQDNNAVITITDTGKGIEADILEQLMSGKSVTNGKIAGKGLGFSYAKKTIEQLGGTIALESKVNKGTKQIIKFPISIDKPSWFVDKISLKNIKTIVIVDDFSGIHEIWKEKLKDKNIKLVHIYNSKKFINFITKNKNADNMLYLVDFALEDVRNNGLSLIRKNNLQSKSILVTSKYLEQFVKNESIKNGIKILPKEFIKFDIFG
jgi:signal transduction histidine kinase